MAILLKAKTPEQLTSRRFLKCQPSQCAATGGEATVQMVRFSCNALLQRQLRRLVYARTKYFSRASGRFLDHLFRQRSAVQRPPPCSRQTTLMHVLSCTFAGLRMGKTLYSGRCRIRL